MLFVAVGPVGMWTRLAPCPHPHRPSGQVGFCRRPAVKGGVRPLGIVELDPRADDALGREAIRHLVQVDGLVFQRSPETLDEDVVQAPAPPVHGDHDIGVLERAGEVEAGELAALIRVEDLRLAVSSHRVAQGLDAEPGVHRVRQPPCQDMARRPVHDRNQIEEPPPHRDVGDVGAPDMIGTIHRHIPEQIGINPVRRVGRAGLGRLVDRFQTHEAHQAPNPVTPGTEAVAPQLTHHLPAAVEGAAQKQLVDTAHQSQILRTLALRRVIERRPADREKAALTAQSSSRGGSARSSPCVPPDSSLEPSGQKIPFHRQLADLGVKIANLGFVILAVVVRAVRKHFR